MVVGDPEFEQMVRAARAVGVVPERELTRWRTRRFTVTQEQYDRNVIGIHVDEQDPERAAVKIRREVPPGEWLTLHRRMTDAEARSILLDNKLDPDEPGSWVVLPEEGRWMPVMSDTPTEVEVECLDALMEARGRVLITGLGLGCVPRALLQNSEVTHIDIIEIDPEVIELTGATVEDPRVTIHRGSAVEPWEIFPTGTTWDYAWHDIWTHISTDNLRPPTAEHGISYRRLFTTYATAIPLQAAWAYWMVVDLANKEERERHRELEFGRRVRALPLDEAVEVVYERAVREQIRGLNPEEPITADFMRVIDPEGKLKAHVRRALARPTFWEEFETQGAEREAKRRPSHPNAHLTA